MAPPEFPVAIVRQRREHGTLKEEAARLKRAASRQNGGLEELTRDLARFVEALGAHFDAEESGGAFDEVVQRRPDLVNTTRRLERDHVELRSGFEDLHTRLSDAPARDPEHAAKLTELIHRFEAHESDESRLLLAAWTEDLGVGD